MPGASIRQQIITALDTRLKTILTSGGYNTNAGKQVFEYREYNFEVDELPALIYRDEDSQNIDSYEYHRHKLFIKIEAVVVGTTAAADIRKLIADVITAIGTDLTWGGLAEDTLPESEPINIVHESRKVAGATIGITIDYRTGLWNPHTQG